MSPIPDASWLNAFKLPTQVMLGLLIASGIMLLLDHAKIVELASFGTLTRPSVIILAIVSGSLFIANIAKYFADHIAGRRKVSLFEARQNLRQKDKQEQQKQFEQAALNRIEHLAPQELAYLASCLKEGSQSFYTYVHSPSAATLISKGLVDTPGGTYNQDHYPYNINDFAWAYLLTVKDEILHRDAENKAKDEAAKRR